MIFWDQYQLQFESIGLFRAEQEWKHPARTIDTYEIIFMLEGCAHLEEDGIPYELYPEDVLLLEPQKMHRGTQFSHEPVSFYWLHFKTNAPISPKKLSLSNGYEIKSFLKALLHKVNTPGYTVEEKDALSLLILKELCFHAENQTQESDAFFHQLTEYIRINLSEPLSVKSLALHFGYNKTYLSRRFKQFCGIGLKEYLFREKMNRAKDLLLHSSYSVKEIAGMCGYSEENLFLKFFSYHEKISPTEFRNLYCHTHMNNK